MTPALPVTQPVSPEEAVRLARDLYAMDASARPLPGEYDHNFHLTTADAGGVVVQVKHPGRGRALIVLQCPGRHTLGGRHPPVVLPRVKLTAQGEAFTKVALHGDEHFVWLMTFIPGKVLAEFRPHTNELLHSVGRLLGEIDGALQSFSHPAATRELKWDSAQAQWIRGYLDHVKDSARRATVERVLGHYESVVVPLLPKLRRSVIYGDATDSNVLGNMARAAPREAVSVIDFGDMHHGLVVSEPAIAAAYAMLGKSDPVAAAAAVVSGFHSALALDELELAV